MDRILIDGRLLSRKETGISRYSKEMIDGFIRYFGSENVTVLVNDARWGNTYSNILLCRAKPFNLIHFFSFYFEAKQLMVNFDVFYAPFYSLYPFRIKSIFSVTTVHDLMYKVVPRFFSKYWLVNFLARKYYDIIVKRSINVADLVISVSKQTRSDIRTLFNVDNITFSEGINELGKNADFQISEVSESVRTFEGKSFYLYVGNLRRHKNIPFLIDCFIESGVLDYLVIVGNHKDSEVSRLPANTQVIFLNYVSDTDLRYLYSRCLAFVFPSLYEGFGLPILEALSHNANIISSYGGALSEFSPSIVRLFNPLDKSELISIFREKNFVYYDSDTRKRVMDKYDWKVIVEDLCGVIVNRASERPGVSKH